MAEDRFGPKGNNPPLAESLTADFTESLALEDGLLQRIEDLVASSARTTATDAESVGKCADLIKMMKAAKEKIESLRFTFSKPLDEAKKALINVEQRHTGRLITADATVRRAIDAFNREEQARRQAAERKRIADERADAQERAFEAEQRRIAAAAVGATIPEPEPEIEAPKPAPPVEAQPIRGEYGAAVSSTTKWKHEVLNWELAAAAVLDNDKVREAINKAIASMVKSGARKIAGTNIYPDTAVSIR